MNEYIRLGIAGDLMLGGSVAEKIKMYGPIFPFEKIIEKAYKPDIFFANLECTLSNNGKPPCSDKILLNSLPEAALGLKSIGINMVSVANNHTFDYGLDGFIETKENLRKYGIECFGGGSNIKEATESVVIEKKGIRFAFIAYCSKDTGCKHFAGTDTFGVAPLKPDRVCEDIKKAKRLSDFVIVSLHWGEQFMDYPTVEHINIARNFIEAGAIIVAGSHSHVFQGYEVYKDGLIIYDLGSLIFGDILIKTPIKYTFYLKEVKHKESIIVDCKFTKKGIESFKFLPIYINSDFQATFAERKLSEKIVKRFLYQSKNIKKNNYERFFKGYIIRSEIKRTLRNYYMKTKRVIFYR